MKKKERLYFQRLFAKLRSRWQENKGFSGHLRLFGTNDWMLIPLISEVDLSLMGANIQKWMMSRSISKNEGRKDLEILLKSIKGVYHDKQSGEFRSSKNNKGYIFFLRCDGQILGAVVIAGVTSVLSQEILSFYQEHIDAAVSESRKELEIEDLNETIRPRALALSTVHTLHRLMSSTLDFNELVPRIARLSLQVMKAYRCSIKLLDKKRKTLLPVTTIDLRSTKTKLKKVAIGRYAPGRAVKQSRSIIGRNYLATPLIEGDVLGVITLYDKIDGSPFAENDSEIMETLAEQAITAIKNAQLYEEQERLTMSSIQCIAGLLQARPHGGFVAEASFRHLIKTIGVKLNMNETEIKMMQYAAMLHDTGQISIPEKLLMKKGVLTGSEFDIIKKHTLKGADILSKSKALKPIIPIILYHHENYNGTGYPRGLSKEEIPLAARVMAVISAFEAMITKKPYRKALSISAAVEELRRNSGTQFDPGIVKIFCEVIAQKKILNLLKKELENDNK